ncbi:ATPase with chaperone activity [Hydrogenophaga aquatica]
MDESQLLVPESFVELHVPPGQRKPAIDRASLALRFELCEDMAQMLTEHASQVLVKLGITEGDVLARMLQGLVADEGRLSEGEALWVVSRLAELLQWPLPAGLAAPLGEEAQAWWQLQLARAATA